jgi:mandelate racemase
MSSHLFAEASSHMLAVTPTAHWIEYLDLARAIVAEPVEIVDGTITARGQASGCRGTKPQLRNTSCTKPQRGSHPSTYERVQR